MHYEGKKEKSLEEEIIVGACKQWSSFIIICCRHGGSEFAKADVGSQGFALVQ